MSMVTEVVLLAYPTTRDEVAEIQGHNFETKQDHPHGQFLSQLASGFAGGSKYASWDVFQAAFNHVPPGDVEAWFDQLCASIPETEFVLMVDRGEWGANTLVKSRLFQDV